MAHEITKTKRTGKAGWINVRTVNKKVPMTKEQRKFFSTLYPTEKAARNAAEKRSGK